MRTLPFLPEFHEPVLRGWKTMTTRAKKYGDVGDRVRGPGGSVLEFTAVWKERLGVVAENHFQEEGVVTPSDFVDVWNRIHPRKLFDPDDTKWAHRFRVVSAPDDEFAEVET